jgi:hypothetical protein
MCWFTSDNDWLYLICLCSVVFCSAVSVYLTRSISNGLLANLDLWNLKSISISNVSSDYAYRILTNSLKTNHILWFFYETKQNRDIKVMIKNLHHSYQPINILHSLNDQGLQALNATPKSECETKELLDVFIVSFHLNTDINRIFNIKTICRTAVSAKSTRSNKSIPQCKICQLL